MLFYKPIQVSSVSMHLFIFYLRPTCCLDGMYNLILCLSVQTFLGFVCESDYPLLRSPSVSIEVGIFPLVVFLKGCAIQHLVLLVKSCGLCYIIEGSPLIFYVQSFWRRLRSCQWILCQFPRKLVVLFCTIFSEFYALFVRFLI